MSQREIKSKNIFLVYFLSFFTFGIYSLVWTVKSKRDMNSLGAEIPTSWLLIIPVVNLFWLYKYAEGFAQNVKKDDSTMMWFVMSLFAGIIMPFVVQSELNKISEHKPAAPKKRVRRVVKTAA